MREALSVKLEPEARAALLKLEESYRKMTAKPLLYAFAHCESVPLNMPRGTPKSLAEDISLFGMAGVWSFGIAVAEIRGRGDAIDRFRSRLPTRTAWFFMFQEWTARNTRNKSSRRVESKQVVLYSGVVFETIVDLADAKEDFPSRPSSHIYHLPSRYKPRRLPCAWKNFYGTTVA